MRKFVFIFVGLFLALAGCQSTKSADGEIKAEAKQQITTPEQVCLHDGGGWGIDICVPKGQEHTLPMACIWGGPAYGNDPCECWNKSLPNSEGKCTPYPTDRCIYDLSGTSYGYCPELEPCWNGALRKRGECPIDPPTEKCPHGVRANNYTSTEFCYIPQPPPGSTDNFQVCEDGSHINLGVACPRIIVDGCWGGSVPTESDACPLPPNKNP